MAMAGAEPASGIGRPRLRADDLLTLCGEHETQTIADDLRSLTEELGR
jgi:hypothetical protein